MIYKGVLVLAIIFSFAACGTQEVKETDNSEFIQTETPQEAIDLAIQAATDKCTLLPGDECKEFNLACSEQIELTEGQKANNVEDNWCLAISYQKRSPTISSDWKDGEINLSVENHGGSWEQGDFCICGLEDSDSDSSDN